MTVLNNSGVSLGVIVNLLVCSCSFWFSLLFPYSCLTCWMLQFHSDQCWAAVFTVSSPLCLFENETVDKVPSTSSITHTHTHTHTDRHTHTSRLHQHHTHHQRPVRYQAQLSLGCHQARCHRAGGEGGSVYPPSNVATVTAPKSLSSSRHDAGSSHTHTHTHIYIYIKHTHKELTWRET